MLVSWNKIKEFIDDRSASVHFEETDGFYEIEAYDGAIVRTCQLSKNPSDTTELDDFQANYYPYANVPQNDGTGRTIVKTAASMKGTTYLADFCTITTGLSISSETWNGGAGNYTVKYYNAGNTELSSNDSLCVKTVVDYAPSVSYEIIGGNIHITSTATQSCKLWVIGGAIDIADDYPSAVKEMVRSLDFECVKDELQTDGRASKYMAISTIGVQVPTNKLQFIIKHAAGYQYKFMAAVEKFR